MDDDTILNLQGLLRDLYYFPCDIWGSFEIVSFDSRLLTYRGWSDNQEGAMRAHLRCAILPLQNLPLYPNYSTNLVTCLLPVK